MSGRIHTDSKVIDKGLALSDAIKGTPLLRGMTGRRRAYTLWNCAASCSTRGDQHEYMEILEQD